MSQINDNTLEAMLEVLLVTIYADNVVKPEERASLIEELPTLSAFTEYNPHLDEHEIRNQIVMTEPEVRRALNDGDRSAFESGALERITDKLLQRVLYAAMIHLAKVDHEYHPSEANLIGRAALMWGI